MYSSVQHLQRCICVGSGYKSFVVLNRGNIQSNVFGKKRSENKKRQRCQPLTAFVTRIHPKSGGDEFSGWYYEVLFVDLT